MRATKSREGEKKFRTLDEVVQGHIQEALIQTGGNKLEAAKLLGISRRALYRRLETFREPAPPIHRRPQKK